VVSSALRKKHELLLARYCAWVAQRMLAHPNEPIPTLDEFARKFLPAFERQHGSLVVRRVARPVVPRGRRRVARPRGRRFRRCRSSRGSPDRDTDPDPPSRRLEGA
jgi:hypothetical protein